MRVARTRENGEIRILKKNMIGVVGHETSAGQEKK